MESTTDLNFGKALEYLKRGHSVARAGWNNPNISVHLQTPDENSKMTLPYLYMEKVSMKIENKEGKEIGDAVQRFPFNPGADSLIAEDWFVY